MINTMSLARALVLCGGFAGCAAGSVANKAPPIPLAELLANPAVSHLRLSPDGTRLAWIADHEGAPAIWLARTDSVGRQNPDGSVDAARAVTASSPGLRSFVWSGDGRYIVYSEDDRGAMNFTLHGLDVGTGAESPLVAVEGAQAVVVAVSTSAPERILIAVNDRAAGEFDVHSVDLATGQMSLVIQNPGFLGSPSGPDRTWHAGADLEIRVAIGSRPDGGADLYARVASKWHLVGSWSLEEGEPTVVDANERTVLLIEGAEANTQRLTRIDIHTGVRTVLAEDDVYDVDLVLLDSDDQPVAVAFYRAKREWQALNSRIDQLLSALEAACPGDFSFESQPQLGGYWLVLCSSSDDPGRYLLIDSATGQSEVSLRRQPGLARYTLQTKAPIDFRSRDGLRIHGYLTPPGGVASAADQQAPTSPPPAVVLVHGGPWARDFASYDPIAQWLASRGYAVLQVNFRGSTGYGREFAAAGHGEFGSKMQDDVTDAVGWAAREGHIDPARVAIMGGSYGGYAALAGVAFTPDVYRAAVSMVGFSNLITLLERVAPMFQSSVSFYHSYIGDPVRDRPRLERQSPFFHADQIRVPVMLAHGERDPLVPVEESRAMATALTARGIPNQLLIFPNEGHGLRQLENRLTFFRAVERFLACQVLDDEGACGQLRGPAVDASEE